MNRLLIFTEHFPPSFAATGQLLEELAQGLSRNYRVEVVTSSPDPEHQYQGKTVKVIRFFNPGFNKNNIPGRMMNGLLFVIQSFFKILLTGKNDRILFVSNPPFLPFCGPAVMLFRKLKFVFLIHDQYPEIAINLGYLKTDSLIARIWRYLNLKVYQKSQAVISLGDKMADHLVSLYPDIRSLNRIRVIPNWADQQQIYPLNDKTGLKKKYGLPEKLIIQYSGNIGLFHGLDLIQETIILLKDHPGIFFQFIGEGGRKNRLIQLKKDLQLDNLLILPYVSKENLCDSLNCADLALISLDSRSANLAIPSKFYGIIATGTPPVACIPSDTDLYQEINDYQLGIAYSGASAEEFAAHLTALAADQKRLELYRNNTIKHFRKNYDFPIILSQYDQLIKELDFNMVDFHCHSNCSDGILSPEDLVLKAQKNGINCLALTDHDTIAGIERAKIQAQKCGILLIPGVEISCEFRDHELHIIGLFFDEKNTGLNLFFEKLQGFRRDRNQKMMDKFKEIGIILTREELTEINGSFDNIGKPNFARLLYKKGIIKNEMEAYSKYLSQGGIAEVEKEKVTPEEAIRQIKNAGGIAILAHPDQLGISDFYELSAAIAVLREQGLDGIEVYYHNYRRNRIKNLKKIAKSLNLILSGGSDYHGGMKNCELGYYGSKKKIPPELYTAMKNYIR